MESRRVTSTQELLTELTRLIDCPVTMESLDKPITFSCGHSFSDLAEVRALDSCPQCRAPTHGTVANKSLAKIVESLRKLSQQSFQDLEGLLVALRDAFSDEEGELLSEKSMLLSCGHCCAAALYEDHTTCQGQATTVFAQRDYLLSELINSYQNACKDSAPFILAPSQKITPTSLKKIYIAGNDGEFFRHVNELSDNNAVDINFIFKLIDSMREILIKNEDIKALDLLKNLVHKRALMIEINIFIFSYLSLAIKMKKQKIVEHFCQSDLYVSSLKLNWPMVQLCLLSQSTDDDFAMISTLLKTGVEPHQSSNNQQVILRCLLRAGFDPSVVGEDSTLPIQIIVRQAREDWLSDFVAAVKANPALALFRESGDQPAIVYEAVNFLSEDGFKALLSLPRVDVNVCDTSGDSPLNLAIRNNRLDKVLAMLSHPSLTFESIDKLDKLAQLKIRGDLQLYIKVLRALINFHPSVSAIFLKKIMPREKLRNKAFIRYLSTVIKDVRDVCLKENYTFFIRELTSFLVDSLLETPAQLPATELLSWLLPDLDKAWFIKRVFAQGHIDWIKHFFLPENISETISIIDTAGYLEIDHVNETLTSFLQGQPKLLEVRLANDASLSDFLLERYPSILRSIVRKWYAVDDKLSFDEYRKSFCHMLSDHPGFFIFMLENINAAGDNDLFLFLYNRPNSAASMVTAEQILRAIENRAVSDPLLYFLLETFLQNNHKNDKQQEAEWIAILSHLAMTSSNKNSLFIKFIAHHGTDQRLLAVLPKIAKVIASRSNEKNKELLQKIIDFINAWVNLPTNPIENTIACLGYIFSMLSPEYTFFPLSNMVSFYQGDQRALLAQILVRALQQNKSDHFILALLNQPSMRESRDQILLEGKSQWHLLAMYARWHLLINQSKHISNAAKNLPIESGQYAGNNLSGLVAMIDPAVSPELLRSIYTGQPNQNGLTSLMMTLQARSFASFLALWTVAKNKGYGYSDLSSRANFDDEFYTVGDTLLLVAIKASAPVSVIQDIARAFLPKDIFSSNSREENVFSLLHKNQHICTADKILLLEFFINHMRIVGHSNRSVDIYHTLRFALQHQSVSLVLAIVDLLRSTAEPIKWQMLDAGEFEQVVNIFPAIVDFKRQHYVESSYLAVLVYILKDMEPEQVQRVLSDYFKSNQHNVSFALSQQSLFSEQLEPVQKKQKLADCFDKQPGFFVNICSLSSMLPMVMMIGTMQKNRHNIACYEFRRTLAEYTRTEKIPADIDLKKLTDISFSSMAMIFNSLPASTSLHLELKLLALYDVLKKIVPATTKSPETVAKYSIEDLMTRLLILEDLYSVNMAADRHDNNTWLAQLHKIADGFLRSWLQDESALAIKTGPETLIMLDDIKKLHVVKTSHALKGYLFASNMVSKIDRVMQKIEQALAIKQTSSSSSNTLNPN